jgi:hypothetical protein
MKLSTLIRWAGPAAIAGGLFMVFSDLAGLPIHVPYLSQEAPTGYGTVASGMILFALVLLLVGMVGLYAGRPGPGAPKVIEYGDAHARYVLVDVTEEETGQVGLTGARAEGRNLRSDHLQHHAAARRYLSGRQVGGRG